MSESAGNPPRGFKPHVVLDLVGITGQTLRYWRSHLDPIPNRKHFSSPSLLAIRLIKSLVKEQKLSVEALKSCDFRNIFEEFELKPLSELKDLCILLDERTKTIRLVTREAPYDDEDFNLHRIGLGRLVKSHIECLCRFGSGQSNVVDFPFTNRNSK